MTLQEVLRTNKIKVEKERLAKIKHERNVKIIRTLLVVVLLITVIVVSNHYDRKAIEKCTQDHDINYCIAGL